MNLNGYRPTFKNKWLFLQYRILTHQGLMLLEFYADNFDFDKRHDKYGQFEVDFISISNFFHCSENTIRNWHNELLNFGFIKKTNRKHSFQLACFERYVPSGKKWDGKSGYYEKIERDQPIGIILQNFGIDFQSVAEKIQPTGKNITKELKPTTLSPSKYLISSKGQSIDISSNKAINSISGIKTDDEYQKIYDEGNYSRLTTEDMKWIDENAKEKNNVVYNQTENEDIKLIKNDNCEKYIEQKLDF